MDDYVSVNLCAKTVKFGIPNTVLLFQEHGSLVIRRRLSYLHTSERRYDGSRLCTFRRRSN